MEEWKSIEGFEGFYEVSNIGRVKSKAFGHERLLKPQSVGIGRKYLAVSLWQNGKGRQYYIHRLVAMAFIPNPDNLSDVNHLDEDTFNNNVDNLQWSGHRENIVYGTRTDRAARAHSRAVAQFSKGGDFIARYTSAKEAERKTGIAQSAICNCCHKKKSHRTAGNYLWEFAA